MISDEIYQQISYSGPSPSFGAAVPSFYDRTLLINGASKAYSMTGWRIGYAAGPLAVIKAMNDIKSHSSSNASTVAQYAAFEAFNGSQQAVHDMTCAFKERRDVIVRLLNEIPGIHCANPGPRVLCLSGTYKACSVRPGAESLRLVVVGNWRAICWKKRM